MESGIPCVTTVQGMTACVQGIEALLRGSVGVRPLQALQPPLTRPHSELREA